MKFETLNDETIPQFMELITPEDAEKKYNISKHINYPFLDFAEEYEDDDDAQEIRLFEGDLHVTNTKPSMDRDWNRYNLIIDGNLIVDNDFFWAESGNGCFFLITGNVKARYVTIDGNADVAILGDLEVEHDIIGNHGEDGGCLAVDGSVKAPVVFEGFNFVMALSQEEIGTYIEINRMDSADNLLPQFIGNGGTSIDAKAIEAAVRKGEKVLKTQ